jgi:preprotein translocase subunit SecF
MIWGGEVIRDFTLTLAVGILVGTYSSVFVASPVLLAGHERSQRRQERARRQQRGGR